jgi:hypothetical protein
MPSILGSTYPVSALVPSIMPATATGSDSRQTEQKPNPLSAAEPSRILSNRVTAFLATDQAAKGKGSRPDGPGVGSQGPRGPALREINANTGADKALSLPETSEDDGHDDDAGSALQSGARSVSIILDDAQIYRPSSLY